jgi:hypothetical protein
MPNLPVTASSRELQRPRPIPRRVRDVITLMVYGRIDDESGLTMQSAFILASGAGGLGFALLLWRLVLRRASTQPSQPEHQALRRDISRTTWSGHLGRHSILPAICTSGPVKNRFLAIPVHQATHPVRTSTN